jgi:ATP-dependent protease HslVU (ClpYQ) peptidase subunit
MTCIIGLVREDTVWIGGDSVGSDEMRYDRADEKVFKNGDYLIGFAGSYRLGQIAKITVFPEFPKNFTTIVKASKKSNGKKLAIEVHPMERQDIELWFIANFIPVLREAIKEEAGDERFEFIIAADKWLFVVESDYQAGMYKSPYIAIGSGSQIALGALAILEGEPDECIAKAIRVAAKYDKAVGGDLVIMNTADFRKTIFEMGELNE